MPDQGGGAPLVPRTARIVHGRIESGQIGVNYPTDLAIVGDVGLTARALAEAVQSAATSPRLEAIRRKRSEQAAGHTRKLREAYLASAREHWDRSPLTWPRCRRNPATSAYSSSARRTSAASHGPPIAPKPTCGPSLPPPTEAHARRSLRIGSPM